MRFIEISEGVSIRIDSIVAIDRIDELTTSVRTLSDAYVANFPYEVVLKLVEEEGFREEKPQINEYEQYIRL